VSGIGFFLFVLLAWPVIVAGPLTVIDGAISTWMLA